MKRPSFQFYPGDWLNDAALRMVSVGARGMWMDMICLMHQGSSYGYLKVNHRVILTPNLARMIGATLPEVEGWIEELSHAGVFSIDHEGCIFSRRMIRDEETREARAAGGKLGGNPTLTGKPKDNGKVNLSPNLKPTPSSSSSSPSSSTEALKTIVSEYPPSFEGAWSIYPKRPGASKKEAFKAWSARIKGGIPEMEIIDGIKRYAEYCTNSDVDPQYIKQPATFFGVGLHFQSDWTYKPRPTNSVQEARLDTARQIMGGSYGNNRQVIDITPTRPNEGCRAPIPEIIDGIWDADVGEMAGIEHP